jgi:hypothetical protein
VRSSAESWNTRPIAARTPTASRTTSRPATIALPPLGAINVESMWMVELLPEPFGPSKPKNSPFAMSKSRPSTASTLP